MYMYVMVCTMDVQTGVLFLSGRSSPDQNNAASSIDAPRGRDLPDWRGPIGIISLAVKLDIGERLKQGPIVKGVQEGVGKRIPPEFRGSVRGE